MKVLILGSNGLVGSSLNRVLSESNKVSEIIGATRNDANLFSLEETKTLISKNSPNVIINAAAKVGGIYANDTFRTEFIMDNLKINMNVIEACKNYEEIKIVNLGSSCIYPLNAENPIKEESLMTGELEPTNSPYAIAKIASIEMGRALNLQYGNVVLNLMPTNLYGPNDNFSENKSHVIPGLIRRMHNAKMNNEKEFSVWGTGTPLREFLFVDDLSSAIEYLLDYDVTYDLLNVGSGLEISISKLANLIKSTINFKGNIVFDKNMPNGNPRKFIDSTKINNLGWKPRVSLEDGLEITYKWFLENK
jgi:GDP-L-fucose synthase